MTLIRLDSKNLTYNANQTNSNPKSNQSKPNQIKTEPTQKITGTKRNETKNEKKMGKKALYVCCEFDQRRRGGDPRSDYNKL